MTNAAYQDRRAPRVLRARLSWLRCPTDPRTLGLGPETEAIMNVHTKRTRVAVATLAVLALTLTACGSKKASGGGASGSW